ncbi:MAG: hypothetical protein IH987_06355 [Planctomycetes bacterium]|nr:hypothetical protein [Planctomycetota bacterium]
MPAGTVSKARTDELPIILALRGSDGHPPVWEGLMIERACNLWLESAQWRCIPTSGATTPSGEAIMDEGIALEAVQRYQSLDADLGRLLASRGNHVHELRQGLASFPIKQYQWSGIDLNTIVRSGHELCELVGDAITLLPRFNQGADALPWETFAEALSFLPDNIVIVQHS